MKPIYKSLVLAAMTLQVSLNLQAQVIDGESTTQTSIPAEVLNSLRVDLVAPNVSGARDLLKSGECTIDGSDLSIMLNSGDWIKGDVYRLQVSATFGTQTEVIYALDVNVPRYDALASEPQEYEDSVTVVSTYGDGTGESDLQRAKSVTYEQLKAIKNAGGLIAGQMYRITDYETTTAAEDTKSAGHAFDLIVTAINANTLSERAHAIQHEGDEYFADCNLASWEVWYTIENDADHYKWADPENGKGVIYRLIDEWRNDFPYDFKNIMFKRWAVTGLSHINPNVDVSDLESDFVYNEGTQDIRYGTHGENYTQGSLTFEVEDATDFAYYYAFSWITEDRKVQDASIVGQTLPGDENIVYGVHSNSCGIYEEGSETHTAFSLPNNVIAAAHSYENGIFYGIYSNTFGNGCYSNTFGNGCYSNTFGNGCYSNTFGNDCNSNTFGNDCNSNTFGNGCIYNTFGNGCYSNTFGNDCNSNTFGNDCNSNTFGNNYYYNTFGNDCYYNTFGNGCIYNTFGNNCISNTFGNNCISNTFGNGCYSNTFGNNCYANTFGNGSNDNGVLKDYMRYVTLEAGVQYVDITCADTTSDGAYGQNILVHSGVAGTENARKTCSIDDAGNDFLTEFGTVVQGTIS